MAAAIALGFRYPVAWSFILLTKVTPGIGLVWFAARREWRHLAIALGFTGALVAVSLVLEPQLWVDWLEREHPQDGRRGAARPVLDRHPAAGPTAARGRPRLVGRADRPAAGRWRSAATLALPILWPSGLALLAALWPIAQRRPELEPRGTGSLRSVPTA